MMMFMRSEFGFKCSEDAFASVIKANELEILQWLCRHFPDQFAHSRLEFESLSSGPYIQQWLTLAASSAPSQ